MLSKGNPLIVNALSEGVVLVKTPEFEAPEEAYRNLVRRGLKNPSIDNRTCRRRIRTF